MGGRGSSYSNSQSTVARFTTAPNSGVGLQGAQQAQQQNQNTITNQVPTPQNTPVNIQALTNLQQMSDDQLTKLFNDSKKVDMPNHLNDKVDATQKFAYQIGLNAMPQVLDTQSFNQFMQDNNISQSQILSRSVTGATYSVNGIRYSLKPTDITDMMKYSQLNYIGGKQGGQVYGAGTYFDMNGGRNTGYGNGATAIAVLNPNTARVISKAQLKNEISTFIQKNPKFANAVSPTQDYTSSTTLSIYALAMGYNVIKDGYGSYHNIIDRAALVYRDKNL